MSIQKVTQRSVAKSGRQTTGPWHIFLLSSEVCVGSVVSGTEGGECREGRHHRDLCDISATLLISLVFGPGYHSYFWGGRRVMVYWMALHVERDRSMGFSMVSHHVCSNTEENWREGKERDTNKTNMRFHLFLWGD